MHACLQSVPHVRPNNMLQPYDGESHRDVEQPCHHVRHCSEPSILYMCIRTMPHIVYTYSPEDLQTGLSQVELYELKLHLSLLSRVAACDSALHANVQSSI